MKKGLTFLVVIISATILVVTVVRAAIYNPETEVAPSIKLSNILKKQESLPGHPIYLTIPSLDIKANVQEVGITERGNVATPNNFKDVGWYKYGPLPGSAGTSIIDGHVDNGFSLPGVFVDLKNIKVGDSIYIETKEGNTLHFAVQDLQIYNYDSKINNITTKSNDPRLVLITCYGNWISKLKTHNKRLVVVANLVR